MSDRHRHRLILLLVAGLLAASAFVIAAQPTSLGLDLQGGVELVYQASPTSKQAVTPSALTQTVHLMNNRVDQFGVDEPSIFTTGTRQITVELPNVQNIAQAVQDVGSTAQLELYDWEANVLTPTGRTVAGELPAANPSAETINQLAGSAAAGQDLYNAVLTASHVGNPPVGATNARAYAESFLFGDPGTGACAHAAASYHVRPIAGQYCYLAGPLRSARALELEQPGATVKDSVVLTVPRGVAILEALPNHATSQAPPIFAPTARFYPLLDRTALQGSAITDPLASTDADGNPAVTFSFSSDTTANAFQAVTATIARRARALPFLRGAPDLQHFAVALDTQLISVPTVNPNLFPDGIPAGNGAEITGDFTTQSASALAEQLRLGALPLSLTRIAENQVSASLGKQALHQGLIAGAIGLAIVALFLLFYYRFLGLIAVGGLAVYSLYFYALIKLIPITMTLAGIAGLILTIGVAADANVVIFERVKEEIRAGRSVRAGIVAGYQKGLTAIIDANVVTIMTAFILFVLATSDVKGFAFTLGIGTMVSLFTAVMATQAILMTSCGSRAIQRPSALGTGGKKHVWTFDFMGASKYFFSLSGCILLIGALAVGGRGLNLGIDFTSGTEVSVGLAQPATQQQVINLMTSIGVKNAQVQRVTGDKSLGKHGFQIDSNKLPSTQKIAAALQNRFGISRGNGAQRFNATSIGPSFGKSVANSAIEAIIASLIVISLYIALRFEWKFAIPVLIALMHDLLITSGVYALTGRTVTADTVAALLTILGYSLYDTIIVFDRVRENIPRMPRAAFSQIVNRSMSEVLTRSLVTTSCTLLPVIALLFFGGTTLKDFAFALLIGVASGAYSSIFIASPVLTHWKEREHSYAARRHRIEQDLGYVPAYASAASDIEPKHKLARRQGRLTTPDADNVSAAEFEKMKRDLDIEPTPSSGRTSRAELESGPIRGTRGAPQPTRPPKPQKPSPGAPAKPALSAPAPELPAPAEGPDRAAEVSGDEKFTHAPDVAENEGMLTAPKPKPPPRRSKNRGHGRR